MTELQKLYLQARVSGMRHYQAIRDIVKQTGLDQDTIVRCLARASSNGWTVTA